MECGWVGERRGERGEVRGRLRWEGGRGRRERGGGWLVMAAKGVCTSTVKKKNNDNFF